MKKLLVAFAFGCASESEVIAERVVFGSYTYGCTAGANEQRLPLPEGLDLSDDSVVTATYCYTDGTCITDAFSTFGDGTVLVYCQNAGGTMTLRWISLP